MNLSIIIVNFNTPKITIDCLISLKKFNTGLEYEIILIDNAPREDFKSQFEFYIDNLIYIKLEKNIGFGRANNLGMELAKGKYFLLLNSDTILVDNSLRQCYDFMELEDSCNVGLLGCKLLNDDLSYQLSFSPYTKSTIWNYFKSNNPILFKLFNTQKDFHEIKETQLVGDVSGAFMFLRKAVFEKVKGFDPDFFLYCEETEWCRNRISKHYDIVYYPHSQVIHFGGKSAPRQPMLIQSTISEYLFWYKCGYSLYFLFILCNTLNAISFLFQYIFSKAENRHIIANSLKRFFLAIPYCVYYIPKFKNQYNSRKYPLIYKGAKSFFFN